MSDLAKWAKPVKVDGPAMAFGASAREIERLMPPMAALPVEFRDDRDPWCHVVAPWFFEGLTPGTLRAKPGVDERAALAHCAAIMRSFAPSHEHKTAGVAWLLSQWFEVPASEALAR